MSRKKTINDRRPLFTYPSPPPRPQNATDRHAALVDRIKDVELMVGSIENPQWLCLQCGQVHFLRHEPGCERCGWQRPAAVKSDGAPAKQWGVVHTPSKQQPAAGAERDTLPKPRKPRVVVAPTATRRASAAGTKRRAS
jgi:ribosomal protein L37E